MKPQVFMILCGSAVASATAPCTPSPAGDAITEDNLLPNSEYPATDSDKSYETLTNVEDGLPSDESTVPVPVPSTFDDVMPADFEDDYPKTPCSKEDGVSSSDEEADNAPAPVPATDAFNEADIAIINDYGAASSPKTEGSAAGPAGFATQEQLTEGDLVDCGSAGPIGTAAAANNAYVDATGPAGSEGGVAGPMGDAAGPMGSATQDQLTEGGVAGPMGGAATDNIYGAAATGPMGSATHDQLTEGDFADGTMGDAIGSDNGAATANVYGDATAPMDSGFDTQDPLTEGDFTDDVAADNAYGAMTAPLDSGFQDVPVPSPTTYDDVMAGEGPMTAEDDCGDEGPVEEGCGDDENQGLDDCGEEGADDEGCEEDEDQDDSEPCPELPEGATEGANPDDIKDCYSVAVEGDAVYCVEASPEDICGKFPEGHMCPRVGAQAEANCVEGMQSYNPTTKDCVLPEDAVCATLEDGASACVIPDQMGTQYSAYSAATKETVGAASIALLLAVYLF